MPGIMDIYVAHAENHISNRAQDRKIHEISRKQVELEVLQGIDDSTFPIEMKMCWYHAILHSSLFESIWIGATIRYKIPPANLERYVPDESQLELKIPAGMEQPIEVSNLSRSKHQTKRTYQKRQPPTTKHRKEKASPLKPHPPSPALSVTSSSSSTTSTASSATTPSQMALAAKLGIPTTTFPLPPPTKATNNNNNETDDCFLPDPHGLTRQTGDDGAYGSSPRRVGHCGGGGGGTGAAGRKTKRQVRGNAKYVKGSAMESLKRMQGRQQQ